MKRYKKIISMLLLLILALTQLTTYAAIVSDNDGSAFVTKAEFEGLKKSFSEQVDNYNTSIDNKIDGAIAGYLAGLVSKKTIVDLPYADWEKVTSLNYALENDYWYPNVSLTVAHLAGMMYDLEITTNPIRFGYENWWAFAQLLYDRPSTRHSKRLLCDAGNESNSYPDYIIWGGLAKDYIDNISLSRTYHCGAHGNHEGYLWGSMSDNMTICYATRIKNGYFPNLVTETTNVWEPKTFWIGSDGNHKLYPKNNGGYNGTGTGYREVTNIFSKSNTTSIVLNEVDDEKTTYDHIINYSNNSYDYFSDIDWLKTFTTITDNTLTRETQLQELNRFGMYSNLEFWNQNHLARTNETDPRIEQDYSGIRVHDAQNLFDIVSGDGWSGRENTNATWIWGDYNLTDNTTIVSVGLIPKNYDGKHIYQTSKKFSQTVDNLQINAELLNLYNGFIVLAAKQDDYIEWNPVFKDTYSNGTATDFELNVQLAIEPFGEGNTVTSNDKYILLDGQTTAAPITTTDKKCSIKFTMPTNGVVYMKWWPSSTTIQSTNWEATLDLTQCGTYSRSPG